MNTSIIISVATCVLLIGIILFHPSIKLKGREFDIYWLVPLVGGALLLALNSVSIGQLKSEFLSNSTSNPLKVLLLFFSMSLISIYLDETGFFEYLATVTVKRAHSSQKRLFIIFYITVSILTIFTSNDIVILTFTPFICKFAKHAKIDPLPYVVAEFVGANTWSMLLIIGNPTNIYLTAVSNIAFLDYLLVMAIPTVLAGVGGFVLLYLLFIKKLNIPIQTDCETVHIEHKSLSIIGIIHLGLCTVTLAVSGYVNIEMWVVSLIFALSLFNFVAVYRLIKKQKPTILIKTVKRLPWQLAPTLIGMFVVVLALVNSGVTDMLSKFFGSTAVTLKYGVVSTLFSNFMNNIPMSVFFGSVIGSVENTIIDKALYSTVIGSNIGALLTPCGALAGIMFTKVLKRHGVDFGFLTFVKYGALTTLLTLTCALAGLEISFAIIS